MNKRIKKFTNLTFFVTLEIVLCLVPFLGFIPLGFINATTLHIPVILAGIMLGKKEGMIVGFVFGMLSFLTATFNPGPTSFLFTPFFSLGNTNGNFFSLLIAFGPRILMGYVSAIIFEFLRDKISYNVSVIISAIAGAMTNTLLVMSLAYFIFGDAYAQALNIDKNILVFAILSVIFINGSIEAIFGAFISLFASRVRKRV